MKFLADIVVNDLLKTIALGLHRVDISEGVAVSHVVHADFNFKMLEMGPILIGSGPICAKASAANSISFFFFFRIQS